MAREELPHSIAVTADEVEERETADGPLLDVRVHRPGRARLAEGHRHRPRRRGAQGGGHRGPPRARGAARDARAPRDAGQGRPRLAAPRGRARPPRPLIRRASSPVHSLRDRRALVIMRVPPRSAVGVPELSFGESTAVESGRSPCRDSSPREADVGPHAPVPARRHDCRRRDRRRHARELWRQHGTRTTSRTRCGRRASTRARSCT